jgi:hypothetical protein
MGFVRQRRPAIASATVLVLAAASLTVFALSSDGNPVQHVDLNDGGVWVTNHHDGLFGRVNKPAGALDAGFNPPGLQPDDQIDVRQDGAAVVAWDQSASRLFPVDVSAGAVPPKNLGVALPSSTHLQLGGGTLAAYSPATGKVWAGRVDTTTGILAIAGLDGAAKPVATLGKAPSGSGGGALAVSDRGVIYAVSGAGRVATVVPEAAGFAKPSYAEVGAADQSQQVTAVGDERVVLNAAGGKLTLPDGTTYPLPKDPSAVLQQPGPQADSVLVATSKTLLSIPLDGAPLATVYGLGTGAPIAPVRLGSCEYAAWAGGGGVYAQACDGRPAVAQHLDGMTSLGSNPVFRVNRDEIVLNNVTTGQVWDLTTGNQLANWKSILPPPSKKQTKKKNKGKTPNASKSPPPKAKADDLGVRAGQTAVLHVLDNDTHPSTSILAIDRISGLSAGGVHLSVAPDEQTVEASIPGNLSGRVHFSYRIDDGGSDTSTAPVTLHVVPAGTNHAPALRGGSLPDWTLPEGASRSIPVLSNWRDADGDNVVLSTVRASAGTVTTTVNGQIAYTAPLNHAGTEKLTYQVTDGHTSHATSGTVRVHVQGPQASPVRPKAKPDVAAGQVGQPITIHPFGNDVPGSVPTAPGTTMTFAGTVHAVPGLTVATNPSGTITATAARAGSFHLNYAAAYGAAGSSRGVIRIDAASPSVPRGPVAMPDSAALHGQNSAIVDVLANDYDLNGGVLVVQTVSTPDSGQLQARILAGRWLAITALTPSLTPSTQTIRYVVSDGTSGAAEGDVTVTQVADAAHDIPAPQADYATVRSGQSVTIPVLDNDTDPDGSPLSLVQGVRGAPNSGQLIVHLTSGVGGARAGNAFISGRVIKYVAPVVHSEQTAVFDYVVQNAGSLNTNVGRVTVAVIPPPSKANPDQAPRPQEFDVRMVAGTSAQITIPTTAVDPDGDTVTTTGLTAPPLLGRVSAVGTSSLTYLAYPSVTGTDTLRYDVVDSYGDHAEGAVRIGIVATGDPQQPVAVPDTLIAAPGAHVNVDVLANDVYSAGDDVTIFGMTKGNLPAGVLRPPPDQGPIQVVAPADGSTITIPYTISDGGDSTSAAITVTGRAGYDIPPIAADLFAKQTPGSRAVTVEPLQLASDPDGPKSGLRVVLLNAPPQGKVSPAGSVSLPVTNDPQAVAYELIDRGGAAASAVIHIPAAAEAGPQLKNGPIVHLSSGESKTVDIDNYVTAPEGKTVRLTSLNQIVPTPAQGLKVISTKAHSLVIRALPGYSGPAAVTFQITDSAKSYNEGLLLVTVPVQIGTSPVTFSCPTGPIEVAPGGSVTRYLPTICPSVGGDPSSGPGSYGATWAKQPKGLTLSTSGNTLTVKADKTVAQSEAGSVAISLKGAQGGAKTVRVTVSAPPRLSIDAIDKTVKEGKSVVVNLGEGGGYVHNAINNGADLHIVGPVTQTGGASIPRPSVSGDQVTISPPNGTHGDLTFHVVVSDATGGQQAVRSAEGQIKVQVTGPPAVATNLHTVGDQVSGEVTLAWTPSAYGSPSYYKVLQSPGVASPSQSSSTQATVSNLTNGQEYTFSVEACNEDTCSAKSNTVTATPDAVPGAPTNLTVSNQGDGSLTLTWGAADYTGKDVVNKYEVTWAGQSKDVSGLSVALTGLDNDTINTFSVVAFNNKGPGPAAMVQGQSVGTPTWGANAVSFSPQESAEKTPLVTVSWAAPDPNGPSPLKYTVTRRGYGPDKVVCADTQNASCTDDGLTYDGRTYTYTVAATNAGGKSADSTSAGFEAAIAPEPISFTAKATGADKQIGLTIDVPKSNGLSSTVTCTLNGGSSCGSWTFPVAGAPGQTETITVGENGTPESISLQDCNGSSQAVTACDAPVTQQETAYGPLPTPVISDPVVSGKGVSFTVQACGNGRTASAKVTSTGGNSAGTNATFSTSTGCVTNNYTDSNVGYTKTDNITVVVSDPGRTSATANKSKSIPAAPAMSVSSVDVSASQQGSNVTYSAVVCPNGLAADVSVTTSAGGSHSFSVSGSPSCQSVGPFVDNSIGYSTTDTVTVKMTDPDASNLRSPASASGSAKTVNAPAPPAIALSQGGSAQGRKGCSTSDCHYIVVTLTNFTSGGTCSFNSSLGPDGFLTMSYPGNGTYTSVNYYGISGGWVSATCGGVDSGQQRWP